MAAHDYDDPFGSDLPPVDAYDGEEAPFDADGAPALSAGGFDSASEEAFQAREAEREREREELYARLNPRQAEAVDYALESVLVLAGAGSGKTSVLTARIAKLVSSGWAGARNTLAVTFTNKAAQEMQHRLRKLVDKRSVNDMWVGTFHSLCNRMLRENYEAAGLPKAFAILDTDGQEALCRGILKDFGLTKAAVKEAAKARAAAAAKPTDLLSAADPLAAAGALAEDDVEDAGDANEFVTPGQCAKYISSRKEGLHAPEPPMALSTLSTDIEQMEAVYAEYQKRCAKSGLLDFQDLLTRGVQLLRDNAEVRDDYRRRFSAILVDEFQDTNDIQYEWLQLLKSDKAHVMAVGDDSQSIYAFRGANPSNMFRFVKEMTANRANPEGKVIKLEQNYRSLPHILEAANAIIDRNPNQLKKTLFTSQPDKGERIDLITFGNGLFEASSIADSIHAMVKERKVPPSEVAVLYRTNQQSRLIEQELNKRGIPLTVYGGYRFYDRQEVRNVMAYLDLVCDMTRDLSFARVVNFPPRGIGERTVEELRQDAQMRRLSMMETVGERSALMERNPSAIGNAAAQKKLRQLEGFTNTVLDLAEAATEQPLSQLIESVMDRAGIRKHYEDEATGSKSSKEEAEERIKNIEELVSAARQFELDNPHLTTAADQLPEYLAFVALMTSTSESDMSKKNTVSLMTVHSSKGLEFDHVYLTGLEEGVFPHSRALEEGSDGGSKSIDAALRDMGVTTDDDGNEIAESDSIDPDDLPDGEALQEERRLMYVAVTRARKTLTITHANERLQNGQPVGCTPSRFLDEIPAHRLRLVDEAKKHGGKKSFRGSDNREYGGDAFDQGRADYQAKATKSTPARRAELRSQAAFDSRELDTDQQLAGGGAVRVISKRRGGIAEAGGETVIDIDRSHPSLGNRHFLKNQDDDDERARVIDAYERDFSADLQRKGPMFKAVQDLATRVAGGERIALRCWCAPKPCHGDVLAAKVVELARHHKVANSAAASAPASPTSTASSRPITAGRTLAIIGTAGRDKDRPMDKALWERMLADARRRVTPSDTLVSGGAAWADHLAVCLYLEGAVAQLVLHLPAPLEGARFAGEERESAGSAANYYHGLFKRSTGVDGFADLQAAIAKGAKVTEQPAARGYGAMFARNALVAKAADAVLAYTFGDGDEPADGGTKNTWDQVRGTRTHVGLARLGAPPRSAAPTAQRSVPVQPTARQPAATIPPAGSMARLNLLGQRRSGRP